MNRYPTIERKKLASRLLEGSSGEREVEERVERLEEGKVRGEVGVLELKLKEQESVLGERCEEVGDGPFVHDKDSCNRMSI